MSRLRMVMAALLLAASAACGATPTAPLTVERAIPLPGVAGRIDHMAYDARRGRLFVAEVGAGALQAVDLKAGAAPKPVTGLSEPQGVAYLAGLDEVAVASGGDGTVRFYRAEDLQPAGVVQVAGDADNLRLVARTGALAVADGEGLTLIDPARRAVVGAVRLGAHPEGFQVDEAGRRAYANMPAQRRIAVADLATRREAGSWPAGLLFANYPMALSGADVAVVFRAPGRLAVFDAATGRRTTTAATCGDSDDAHFDPRRGRLYVTCGSGEVEAFAKAGRAYRSLGRVATRPGARTALFVPELDRLLVAARAQGSQDAAILVLRPRD